VLSIWHPYNFASRMKWLAVQMAARSGVLRLAPSVTRVETSRDGAQRWFERCGIASQTGEMVVLIGVPSADRKLVVFLLDEERHIAAVLKVGATPGGGTSLLHEAEMLKRLEPYRWAPKLLSIYPELHAAAQEYLPGAVPHRRFLPVYMDLLCALPRTGGKTSLVEVAHDAATRLNPFLTHFDNMAPGLIGRALSSLDQAIELPTMLVHGDFAPWNMRRNPQRGYVLFDWEWASFAGLPAYDLLHFHFNSDRLFGGKDGGYSAIRSSSLCADYFRRMDLDPQLLPPLAVAYLLEQLILFNKNLSPGHAAYLLRQLVTIVGL
jgi:hypothetical protein